MIDVDRRQRSSATDQEVDQHRSADHTTSEVPYEGPLARVSRIVLTVEAFILAAVGITGVVASTGAGLFAHPDTVVLGLRLNLAHALLLLITAVVAGACLLGRRAVLRRLAVGQAVVYTLLFVFGSAFSVGPRGFTSLDLNVGDHVLHGVLAIIGFAAAYVLAAHILEPTPGDPTADDTE